MFHILYGDIGTLVPQEHVGSMRSVTNNLIPYARVRSKVPNKGNRVIHVFVITRKCHGVGRRMIESSLTEREALATTRS
jgi:hypothetical protein